MFEIFHNTKFKKEEKRLARSLKNTNNSAALCYNTPWGNHPNTKVALISQNTAGPLFNPRVWFLICNPFARNCWSVPKQGAREFYCASWLVGKHNCRRHCSASKSCTQGEEGKHLAAQTHGEPFCELVFCPNVHQLLDTLYRLHLTLCSQVNKSTPWSTLNHLIIPFKGKWTRTTTSTKIRNKSSQHFPYHMLVNVILQGTN